MDSRQTADPRPRRAARPQKPAPFVEILFHADLRRVGDRLDPALLAAGPVTIGRSGPAFGGRPLDDPTISREQLEVTWTGSAFTVRALGRRSIALRSLAGAPVTGAAPAGTIVAIGDRALLLLGSDLPAEDDLGMVGRSLALAHLRDRIRKTASRARTVRLHGETGTGKELAAKALHHLSGRPGGLIAVNCASLPVELADSQLFGHSKGAFTGAAQAARGLIRAADGGTLFLDEVAELSSPVQAKLLRVIEDRRVRALGATSEDEVDVLLVAATAEDLEARVAAGSFREDLFARLEAPVLIVPPLRERPDDVARLFAYFVIEQAPDLVADADDGPTPVPLGFVLDLMARPWPRNVRQLRKLVDGLAIEPVFGREARPPAARRTPDREGIRAVLEAHDFVQRRAAEELGIARNTLLKLMDKHGFPRPQDLTDEAIAAAIEQADGDVATAARALQVSERGLALRMNRS